MLIKTKNGVETRVTLTELLEEMNVSALKGKERKPRDYGKRRVWVLHPSKIHMKTHANLKTEAKRQMPSAPAGQNVMAAFDGFDKAGNSFRLRYCKTHTAATALKAASYEPEYITFDSKGWLASEDPELNYYLEVCPNNGSIPDSLRPKNTEVIYGEYDPNEKSAPHVAWEKEINRITTKIFNLSKDGLKIAIEKARVDGQTVHIPDLELASVDQMQSNLINLLKNAEAPIAWESVVLDVYSNTVALAIKQGIESKRIAFDTTSKEWRWTDKDKKVKKICLVEDGVDTEQALLEHLLLIDNKKRDQLIDELAAVEA